MVKVLTHCGVEGIADNASQEASEIACLSEIAHPLHIGWARLQENACRVVALISRDAKPVEFNYSLQVLHGTLKGTDNLPECVARR